MPLTRARGSETRGRGEAAMGVARVVGTPATLETPRSELPRNETPAAQGTTARNHDVRERARSKRNTERVGHARGHRSAWCACSLAHACVNTCALRNRSGHAHATPYREKQIVVTAILRRRRLGGGTNPRTEPKLRGIGWLWCGCGRLRRGKRGGRGACELGSEVGQLHCHRKAGRGNNETTVVRRRQREEGRSHAGCAPAARRKNAGLTICTL